MQSVEDVPLEVDRAANAIRIFEAQDERALDMAGVEEVVERRACRPDVQWTRRARRDDGPGSSSLGNGVEELGSASPGSTRMSAAGRRPSVARPRGPSSVSESSDSERARIVTGAPGFSARASRYDRSPASSSASSVIRYTVPWVPASISDSRTPRGRRFAVAASIGLPCGQISGWPSISSRRASTRGEIATWSRIASSSDSAQPSPTTLVSSHSSRAWRRKIASATARPALVSRSSRPPSCSTSPSAVSRRNISLAAWVVTPRWRAIPAAVARGPSSFPAVTRSASRYSWAAADGSRGSFLRGMASGYRAGQPPNLPDDAVPEPDEPGRDDQAAEQRPTECHALRIAGSEEQQGGREIPYRGSRSCRWS